jgi:alpha-galactosidase
MKNLKIVFIGAGSMSFGIPTYKDIFRSENMRGATICLVDINEANLDRMYRLAVKMNEVTGLGIKIEKTTERRDVLKGAGFVVNSLAIERSELWRHDFNVPKKYGIRHTLGENGGPGALFFTMRTLPLVLDIVRDMEELCPDAYFLNFSNPESRLILGLGMYSKIKCIGLCHGIDDVRRHIAHIMSVNDSDIIISGAGMNHFQWVTSVKDARTGEDLYPVLRERDKTFDPSYMPYSRKMFNTFGLYPTCSDDHLAEYQAYGYEAGEEGYGFDEAERYRVHYEQYIEDAISGKEDVSKWLTPSGERAIDVITAIHYNERTHIPAAIVYNGGAMRQLPDDIAVEIPVDVDGNGIHKVMPPDLPDGVIGLLTNQVSAQRMSVRAAAMGSKELAYQALLCDPVINSTIAAQKINDELFEINKAYIRTCI